MAYQFPLGDYPGKGAGAGEALSDALFGAPEALLFAPAAGWTGVYAVFLHCLLCAFVTFLEGALSVYTPNLMLNPESNHNPWPLLDPRKSSMCELSTPKIISVFACVY